MNGLNFQSHQTRLVVTALTASLATAGLFSLYTTYSKRERRRKLGREVQQSISALDEEDIFTAKDGREAHSVERPFNDSIGHDTQSEELIREQLARNYAFFGAEGMTKIRNSSVVVVGCGGVGSWA